jgi:predicted SprT family Zn-dependent metalloprotease
MQKQIKEAVVTAVKLAREAYPNHTIRMPNIEMSNRMTKSAGRAYGYNNSLKKPLVKFSVPIIRDNGLEAFISRTVYHEVAHIVEHECFGTMGHGARFKHIQGVIFGKDNTRCHNYKVPPTKKRAKVEYRCNGCNCVVLMGPNQHKKQASGQANYRHAKCGSRGTLTKV